MTSGKAEGANRFLRRRSKPAPPKPALTSVQAKEIERRLAAQKRGRDKRWAGILVASGVIVGVQHWLDHLDVLNLPMDSGLQDLTIGYGTAGLLIMVGLMRLPA